LTRLAVRTTTTSTELSACVDEVEAILTRFCLGSTPPREVVANAGRKVR